MGQTSMDGAAIIGALSGQLQPIGMTINSYCETMEQCRSDKEEEKEKRDSSSE